MQQQQQYIITVQRLASEPYYKYYVTIKDSRMREMWSDYWAARPSLETILTTYLEWNKEVK